MNTHIESAGRIASIVAWPLGILLTVTGLTLALRMILIAGGWPESGTDLSVYLHAARTLTEGNNIYDIANQNPQHHPYAYAYPPLFAEVFAILRTVLGDGKGWILWSMFGVGCLFASITLLMRHSGVTLGWKWVILAFGALLIGRLARADIFHVQPHFILLLLIILGVRLFVANRTLAGGVAWALVFCVKPFTGALVFGLMRNGNWRAFFASTVSAGIIFILSFLPFLPDIVGGVRGWMHANSYHSGLPNVTKLANQTFYGTFHRLFGAEDGMSSSPVVHAPGIIPVLAFIFLAIAAAGIWLGALRKREVEALPQEEKIPQGLLQAALMLGLVMSCGPLMEGPHVFMLLPGLAASCIIAWRRWQEDSPVKRRWIAAAALWAATFSFFLVPVIHPLLNPNYLGHVTGWKILLTVKFGVFVLSACLLTVYAQIGDRAVRAGRKTFDWRKSDKSRSAT